MKHTQPGADAGDVFSLRCGSLEIDRRGRRIRRKDLPQQAVTLGSRAFDLLLALIDGRDDVQSSAALLQAVWPGRTVGESNLRVQVFHLRRLLGEDAILHRPGRGYQLLLPVQEGAEPPAAEPPPPPGNLPEALWPLVGRDDWLARLDALLQPGCRLTLLAPGGAGKTTLALAAAAQAAPRFADAAWWVDLAPIGEASQVAATVAQALGLAAARQAPLDHLVTALAARPRALLLLDNAEHVTNAVSELCDRLLRAAPDVAVLVTSRVAICNAGEQRLLLPPLSLPQGAETSLKAARASGAVCLLESRARCIDPRFKLSAANAAVLLDICRRLDGHALALTLAAARLPVMGMQALLDGLDERLQWTQQAAPGAAAPRHLSLQGTLDWSCALLTETQRQLLRRLGVFRGSFSGAAAQAVAAAAEPAIAPADATQALAALVGQGLVSMDGTGLLQACGEAAVFRLHAATQLHARDSLQAAGETDAVNTALARHLCALLQQIEALPHASQRGRALGLLPDVQHLVEWATPVAPTLAAQLCQLSARGWRRAGQHKLLLHMSAPLISPPIDAEQAASQAALQLALCIIDYELDEYDHLLQRSDQVLRLAEQTANTGQRGHARAWQANVMAMRGEVQASEAIYRHALEDFRAVGDAEQVRFTLNNLGWALQAQRQFDEARAVLHEAMAVSRLAKDEWSQMLAHENLSELEMSIGAPLAALPHLEAVAVLARRHPDLYRLAAACMMTALACAKLGELDSAFAAALECLQVSRPLGSLTLHAGACSALACTFLRAGQPGRARSVLHLARRLRQKTSLVSDPRFSASDEEVERSSAELLTPAERTRADIQGDLLSLDEVLQWALAAPQPEKGVALSPP